MNQTTVQSMRNPVHIHAHNTVRYSAQQIADEVGKSESTVRTRWFPWLLKVAPCPLLRDEAGYTELARSLFAEFAKVEQRDRERWVTETKAIYAQEWASAGIIDGELMPEAVGGTLALLQSSNLVSQISIDAELAQIGDFISQLKDAQVSFSQQELESFKVAGIKRGLAQFKVETQVQFQTVNALRHQLLEGQSDD